MSEESDRVNSLLAGEGIHVPRAERARLRIVTNPEEMPRIQLPAAGRSLSVFAKELGALLRESAGFFVRDGEVVRVDEVSRALVPVGARGFRTQVEDYVVPYTVTHSNKGSFEFTETMALETAATVLESEVFKRGLYEVERIHDQRLPVLRRDGRIERLEPGLDVEAKVYTLESSLDYPMDMAADVAKRVLRGVHCEFPFGDWSEGGWQEGLSRSFSVHMTSMISQFGWCLLGGAESRLGFIYFSNSSRSGKSLLAQIALVVTHGLVATTSYKKDEEKMAGTLDVIVRNRAAYAFFDNLKGNISSEELEGFMTGSARKVRLFHTQIERVFPNRTSVIMTGNTLTWSTDIGGRVLVCDLYLEDADPQSRRVKVDRREGSFREPGLRGEMLAAMWALVREWDAAGRPRASGSRAGFHGWCGVYGGIVEHAGFGKPLDARPETLGGGDTDFADMLALVQKLATGVQLLAEYKFEQVVEAALEVNAFEWLMKGRDKVNDWNGERGFVLDPSERKKFANLLSGSWGGRMFVLDDGRRAKWGHRGVNRGRHYQVAVFPAPAEG